MNNNNIFRTYLFISAKKFSITVISDEKKKIYEKNFLLINKTDKLNFLELENFLNDNIFKIEKILKHFIENIHIILETKDFLNIELSVKKNNFKDKIDPKSLNYLLNDAKDYCKKTIGDRKILHIIIQNYYVDNKYYSFLPEDIYANFFSLDLKFISISNSIIKDFEKILKKYQISLNKVVNANYVKEFFEKDQENEDNICILSHKIIEGENPNEVTLVKKIMKNQGFFEEFFNFFN